MPLIAVVQSYLKKHALLEEREVLDAVFLASVLPGPTAVNMVTGVGYRMRGLPGALTCWGAVLLPTFVLVVALSVAYFRWGHVPVVDRLFKGFAPAMVAIIVSAAWSMGRKSITRAPQLAIAAVACGVLTLAGGFYTTLAIVVGAGFTGWLLFRTRAKAQSAPAAQASGERPRPTGGRTTLALAPTSIAWLWTLQPALAVKLLATFAVMSVTLFGSGYVFIPIIQDLVVNGHGWLTRKEFVDGLAISQITPGPILITSAFIGYKVAGLVGAVAATLGMFVPPAALMIVGMSFLNRLKASAAVQAALEGIRPAVVGMLIAAAFIVGRTAPWHWASALILAAALVALIRFKVETALIIPAAGLAGLVFY